MKLEYLHGERITHLIHEMTPLEMAIHSYEEAAHKLICRYENLAKAHASESSTGTEIQRKAERDECLRFLKLERAKLAVIADVQAQLALYRGSALAATTGESKDRNAAVRRLSVESHHPTNYLEKFMRAEGQPKPSSKHTAHHIVPGKGKDPIVNVRTRLHLHQHGIGINDPANGVYLVHKDEYTPHWSMPLSRGHKKYHTNLYETWVANRIRPLKNIDAIKTQLQIIGRILQQNEPKDIPQG
ncbi:MAG: hypothetical protein EOO43_06880 [Flavobacterium sp.]|nr:MAG: hypothetical protein EOO43_06880 [Flavobacterium sp.]